MDAFTTWRFECKLQDCWIGVFWKRSEDDYTKALDVWICLIPCFPLHITRYTAKDINIFD